MSSGPCELSEQIHALIAADALHDGIDDDLKQHLDSCSDCKDAWLVSRAIASDYRSAIHEARLPPPGLIWWRAELRARNEALGAAGRPITFVQGIAAAGAFGTALGILTWFDMSLLENLRALLPLPLTYASLGVIVLLASVALYFAISGD